MLPKFLQLYHTGELEDRVLKLEKLLESCTICPKDCGNNRLNDEIAACYSGRLPIVSSYTAHFGEEPVLSGTNGAGNIFFGNCNLRCVYCQNYQISQTWKTQKKNEISHERLAEMMLELQAKGCHNIGFVSPTHFAPQMARAILIAAENGLNLPIVYNTNAYDSVEVLKLLDGIIDIYLPDLKYADNADGFDLFKSARIQRLLRVLAIKEMFRQTGDGTRFRRKRNSAKSGLLIRLLVLPNDHCRNRRKSDVGFTRRTFAQTVADFTNGAILRDQQSRDRRTLYSALAPHLRTRMVFRRFEMLEEIGIEEGFMQEYEAASHYYRPDFTDAEISRFKDIRDFQ